MHRPEKQRGFTLIELIVVVAIIAILATLIMAGVTRVRQRALVARAKTDIQNITMALAAYHNDVGYYPARGGTAGVDNPETLFRGLQNRATVAAGGGPNSPYADGFKSDSIGIRLTGANDTIAPPDGIVTNRTASVLSAAQVTTIETQAATAAELFVFVDSWGNLYHYREWESRREADKNGTTLQARTHNRDKFDIWSNGPNGINEFGEGDDISNWRE